MLQPPQSQPNAPTMSQATNMAPNQAMINSPGSGESDTGPMPPQQAQPPIAAPAQGAPPSTPGSGEPDTGPAAPQGQMSPQDAQALQAFKSRLQTFSPEDQQFFSSHLTPEVSKLIGMVTNPVVGSYLNQYADQSKVLVPVPRQMATQILAKLQSQSKPTTGQAMPSPAIQPSQPANQGSGMMAPAAPQQPAQATSPQ